MVAQLVRSAAVVAIAALGLVSASSGDAPPPSVAFTDMPVEVLDMAMWALDKFDEAEMDLPPVEFRYHHGALDECRGHLGLHRAGADHSVIDVCADDLGWSTQVMLLHELGHAWSEHTATEEALEAFKELRGYDHWLDYEQAMWHENGTEQAAEILVWGLVDRPIAMSRIADNGCDDLAAGFVTLTGQRPLHGYTDLCDA